jgi:hypothetical protein
MEAAETTRGAKSSAHFSTIPERLFGSRNNLAAAIKPITAETTEYFWCSQGRKANTSEAARILRYEGDSSINSFRNA